MFNDCLSASSSEKWSASSRIRIAGIPVDIIGEQEILGILDHAVQEEKKVVLANINVQGLYCALHSPQMLHLLQDDTTFVHMDGTPIVWLSRLFGADLPEKARNAHIDLIPNLLRKCRDEGWPVVIVGSNQTGAAENQRTFSYMFPGIAVAAFEGFFEIAAQVGQESRREAEILAAIEEFQPKLVLVSRDMPKQEEWITKIFDRIHSSLIMPVGGFSDYFTGRSATPPRYLGPLGLEWAYRLFSGPKQLCFRYIVEPLLLLGLLVNAILSGAAQGRQLSA
jgi:N-acetylglucosaminyldiphosphoundecaprenol N-acetyl-beta-D-mannosaminyltransferase